ncbi:hypothetical protein HAX54_015254, partial [Datura stramonium]|nr:hypothetical protein [Datura stramonium]
AAAATVSCGEVFAAAGEKQQIGVVDIPPVKERRVAGPNPRANPYNREDQSSGEANISSNGHFTRPGLRIAYSRRPQCITMNSNATISHTFTHIISKHYIYP